MNRFHGKPASITLLALAVSTAQAQPGAGDPDVYELITTAIHVRRSETALPVTVLSDKELHDAARATLGDTLAMQPGISNASFGPAVGQTVIRGQQGRRVMNLANGLPNGDASGNSADHAQTVEPLLATAIEVLRGPSTLLYGGGAIGGVVNVIDRRIASASRDEPSFALEARHDTAADLGSLVGSADFATGGLVWHLDAVRHSWHDLTVPGRAIDARYLDEQGHQDESPSGFVANTGGDTTTGTIGVSWILPNGYIGLAVNELDNTYGLPTGVQEGAEGDEHEEGFVSIDMNRTRHDLNGEWRGLAPWADKVSYKLTHVDYAHAEIEGNGEIGTQFRNDSWQQRLQVTHTDNAERHGTIGLQLGNDQFAAVGEESFIPITDIDTGGLFIVEDFHVAPVTIEIGARLNRDEYSPQDSPAPNRSFSTKSLSASALWDLDDAVTLGLSVSSSERAPSAEELYSNFGLADLDECVLHFATGACEIGSTSFDEETSLNTDLTLSVNRGAFAATVTLFHNRFDDYIGQLADGREVDGFPVREYRQLDARFSGVEVDASVQLNDSVLLRVFGDSIDGRFNSGGDVPRMPPRRVGVELTLNGEFSAGFGWSAFAMLIHAAEQDQPGAFELDTDSWSRLDIGADLTIDSSNHSEWLLFVKGRNLSDDEIRLSTSFLRGFAPEAGRSVEAGVRYRY